MKFIGKICDKHPDAGGERYRYKSGKTLCTQCVLRRLSAWRSVNKGLELYQIMGDRKKKPYRRYMKIYMRCYRVMKAAEAQGPGFMVIFQPTLDIARAMPDVGIRAAYLRQMYDKARKDFLAKESGEVVQSDPSS